MSSGPSPSPTSSWRLPLDQSRTTVAGFMREHQTRPRPDIDDFTRADINGGGPARRLRPEDVSPPRRHEFHLYAVYYPVGGCRNNGAFHVPPATKVFAVRPFQVRT